MSASTSSVSSTIANAAPTGVANVLSLLVSIKNQYDQMKENQDICKNLYVQVIPIQEIVKQISQKQTQANLDLVREEILKELVSCLEQCKKVIESINRSEKKFFEKVKAFIEAYWDKKLIDELTQQLQSWKITLNLFLSAKSEENIREIKEKIPTIQKENYAIEQVVQLFIQEMQNLNQGNAHAKDSGRDILTLRNMRLQGADSIGGGDSSSSSSSSSSNAEVDVLKRLRAFFRDGGCRGDKSPDFDHYNKVLDQYQAELGYNKEEKKHALYMENEPTKALESDDAVNAITAILKSLQRVTPHEELESSSASRSVASSATTNTSKPHLVSGRDIIDIDNITHTGSSFKIGGGTWTPPRR